MKKHVLVSVVLVLVFVFMPFAVFAETDTDPIETRASLYFNSYGVTFQHKGDGKFGFTIKCTGVETSTEIGVDYYIIQKKVGNDWYGISSVNGERSYNAVTHTESYVYTGDVGTTYRLKVKLRCENSYGRGYKVFYSPTITAKE